MLIFTLIIMDGSFTLMKTDSGKTGIRNPNPMATLYCAEHVHIAQTRNRIPTPYSFVGQESEPEFIPESVSGSVNEPLSEFHRGRKFEDLL